ncbi:MAG: DUF1028 domain-containing protein [Bacteroidota bacterium]|nr:DUF1028 domain-containing protein [Bacteroidota bacterium]
MLVWLLITCTLSAQDRIVENVATYSIVGWDSITGDLGVAVQSKFLGVGAVVPYAKAGVGAIATQAFANPTFGPRGLELLEKGMSAKEVVEILISSDTSARLRQLGVVDANGNSFSYTGSACKPHANHITGKGYAVQGNILAGEAVVRAMAVTFEITSGDLAERLLSSLEAGEKAGGDSRGKQSAAMLVVRENGGYGGFNDRFIDIRVDDDSLPLIELRRIYNLWQGTFLMSARMRSIDDFNRKRKFTAADIEKKRMTEGLNNELRSKPDDPELLNRIAWILATSEIDHVRALELSKRAVKLAPNKLDFLDTMAECHYRLGNYDEAIAIESELVGKDPSNEQYWKQLLKFKEAKQRIPR